MAVLNHSTLPGRDGRGRARAGLGQGGRKRGKREGIVKKNGEATERERKE